MSLIEVMSGMAILTLVAVGILASLLQSRRLTEGSIAQNTAVTIAQGYLEQLKSMEFAQLDLNPLPTLLDQGVADPLAVSPLPRSAATRVVNTRGIDINNTPANTADDLVCEVAVWVENITDASAGVGEARLVTLEYAWVFRDGSSQRRFQGSLSAVRSQVPTF
ncbi:hypothetical protein ASA1KI_32750 [Opitutales bacterium ASA1]|nr:hypothetical protein ASA1KI_32750 [Opitutales bacterium ASA1]